MAYSVEEPIIYLLPSIKLRYVTDIIKENVHYCKDLMEFEYEIRHLDGIKANFSV